MLLNAETWHEISKENIEELESVDRNLLKRILEVPDSTPNVSLYLEFGIVPIRFLIQAKRILFLKYILNSPEEEIMANVLKAQERNPIKGDWYSTVCEDIKEFELNYTIDEIQNMSKVELTRKVKDSMKKVAFKYLNDEKNEKSKVLNLQYKSLNIQNYFTTNKIKTNQK